MSVINSRRRIIRCHSPVARQSDFVAAAGARAVNRGHARNFQGRDPIENTLPLGDEIAQLACLRLFQECLQIRAGNEARFFRGGNDQPAQRFVAFDNIDMFAQLAHGRGVENIRP